VVYRRRRHVAACGVGDAAIREQYAYTRERRETNSSSDGVIRNRLASSPAAELHPSIIARIPPLVDRYWHAVGSAPPIDECLRAGGRAAPSPGGLRRRRGPARARRLPNDAENIYVQSSDRASDNLPGCPATARRPTTDDDRCSCHLFDELSTGRDHKEATSREFLRLQLLTAAARDCGPALESCRYSWRYRTRS